MLRAPFRLSAALAAAGLAGCAALLPRAEVATQESWRDYDAAQAAIEKIVPMRTTRDDLHELVVLHERELRQRYPALEECRITLEDRPPRAFERRRFNARLDVAIGPWMLVFNREHDTDPGAALRAAVSAAARELDRVAVK